MAEETESGQSKVAGRHSNLSDLAIEERLEESADAKPVQAMQMQTLA